MIRTIIKEISPKKWLFIVLVCELINVGYYITHFHKNHYLPAPFFMDINDTFMDFYSPLYWVMKEGFYTTFNSVYPGLNYFILKFFALGVDANQLSSPFELRDQFPFLGWVVSGIYLLMILIVVNLGNWGKVGGISKFWVFCACALSAPVLFGLERGNLIFWAIFFLGFYLNVSNVWLKAVFFGLLVNIKPYFGILIIQYINIYRFEKNQLIISISISAILFFLFGTFAEIEYQRFIQSYIGFTQKGAITPEGVIAIPHCLMALASIKYFIVNESGHHYTFWFSLLKVLGYLTVLALILLSILRPLNKLELLISCFLIITNFSISTGGYVLIIYIVLIPFLINSLEYKKIIYPILIIYAAPIDWINILKLQIDEGISYIGGGVVLEDITMSIGLGSIFRPIINYLIMFFFILNILKKYSAGINRIQKTLN